MGVRRFELHPREHIALYEACVIEKNFDKGRRIMSAMLPLMDVLESGKFVQSIKHGSELSGLRAGGVRAPLQPLEPCEKDELKERDQNPAVERRAHRRGGLKWQTC